MSSPHVIAFRLKYCLFSLSRHAIGLLVGCRFGREFLRCADYIFVLAPLSVHFLAPAEHPHRSDCSLFLAKHTAVVADRLVAIVTQMTK